jgi:hypothetical protein
VGVQNSKLHYTSSGRCIFEFIYGSSSSSSSSSSDKPCKKHEERRWISTQKVAERIGRQRSQIYARFEVFTAVKIQVQVFWVVKPCSVVVGYQRFTGQCCLHLHNSEDLSLNAKHNFGSETYRKIQDGDIESGWQVPIKIRKLVAGIWT